MSVFSPLQTSFAGGELSKRLRGRVDTDVYRAGLDRCENFEVLPQGPLLMRGGSIYESPEAAAVRCLPFRATGLADDFEIAISDGRARVYARNAGRVTFRTNLLTNGHFDTDLAGWTVTGTAEWAAPGVAKLTYTVGNAGHIERLQGFAGAVTYRMSFRYRGTGRVDFGVAGFAVGLIANGGWQTYTYEFTPGAGNFTIGLTATTGGYVEVDDVALTAPGFTATELAAPWSAAQLEAIQYAQDIVGNRMVLVHPAALPRVIQFTAPDVWELYEAPFINRPGAWIAGSAPAAVEFGFQGRAFYGGVPGDPNAVWASKSGAPFDFTLGSNADDAFSYRLSAKGAVRWLQGQKVLLAGSETVEQSVSGSNKLLAPGDVDVRDESAHGSAPIQAAHIGDQVLYVTPDRRRIRAVNYDLNENGWISKAITFIAEHMTKGGVKEVHFARAPESYVVVVLQDGGLVACTYDRSEGVIGWWRVIVGAPVISAAVCESASGSELWLAAQRPAGVYLERIPFHEIGRPYLDCCVSKVVGANGIVSGLAHLEGESVTVESGGAVLGTGLVVAGGEVTLDDPELEGETVTVGLPFRAKAVTLPREGGSPRGTAQGAKRRNVRVRLRLNDSAIPLVDGDRAAPTRSPSTPMGSPEPLMTGDVEATCLGWSDGSITIEQDLPLRTEILAVFANTAVNDV